MPLLTLLFWVSGLTGLVYEVVWAKYLAVILGSTAHAQAVVLAVFMGGLALGYAVAGRLADRVRRPVRVYGALEAGIGLWALGLPWVYRTLAGLDGLAWAASVGPDAALWLKAAVGSLVMLVPTVLMGATLPVLTRAWPMRGEGVRPVVAWLYFINSAGAAAGALVAGYALIPSLGLDGATFVAAAINLTLAAAAIALGWRRIAPVSDVAAEAGPSLPLGRLALALAFLCGLAALVYEVAWIRLLTLVLGASVYSFSLMLGAFIAGIATGSWWIGTRRHSARPPFQQLAIAQFGLALVVMVTLPLYERLPELFYMLARHIGRTEGGFVLYELARFALCFALMLLPTVFMGASLPLAAQAARPRGGVGATVGAVFGANTAGTIAGSLLAALVLLPTLGIKGTIDTGIALSLAAGAVAAWRGLPSLGVHRRVLVAVPLAAFGVYWTVAPAWNANLLAGGVFREVTADGDYSRVAESYRREELLFYRDDPNATVTVTRSSGDLLLRVNGKPDASTASDKPTQILLGHLPAFLNPRAQDVLMIGLGSGITAGSILTHPVRRLDVVEISPGVIEAGRHFAPFNRHAASDARFHLVQDDALRTLRRSEQRYDLIISEPSNPWIAGVANLFTSEFYQLVRRRLNPGGVVVQWFHAYEMDNETMQMVLRTYCSAFPHVALFQTMDGDWVMAGSAAPLAPDFATMEARFATPAVRDDLARIGIAHLTTLLSLQAAAPDQVALLKGRGELNSLFFPRLEYRAPVAFFTRAHADHFTRNDSRTKAAGRESRAMWLPRYMADRGRPLTATEYEGMVRFYGDVAKLPHLAQLFLSAWHQEHPNDQRAMWLRVRELAVKGQHEAALGLLERLLAIEEHPLYLDMAANLSYEAHRASASFVASDKASLDRAMGYLARLGRKQPGDTAAIAKRMAVVRMAAADPDGAYDRLRQADAAWPQGPTHAGLRDELLGLWLMLAQEYQARGNDRRAANCLLTVLERDPANELAARLAPPILARLRRE